MIYEVLSLGEGRQCTYGYCSCVLSNCFLCNSHHHIGPVPNIQKSLSSGAGEKRSWQFCSSHTAFNICVSKATGNEQTFQTHKQATSRIKNTGMRSLLHCERKVMVQGLAPSVPRRIYTWSFAACIETLLLSARLSSHGF